MIAGIVAVDIAGTAAFAAKVASTVAEATVVVGATFGTGAA